jgi:hypothetical protein
LPPIGWRTLLRNGSQGGGGFPPSACVDIRTWLMICDLETFSLPVPIRTPIQHKLLSGSSFEAAMFTCSLGRQGNERTQSPNRASKTQCGFGRTPFPKS